MSQHIGVVIILVNEGREIALGERKNSYKAGYYGLPGGRVEVGESLHAALQRELEEETGVKLQTFEYVGVVKEHQETRDFVHFAFASELPHDLEVTNAEPEKCEGWEWHDPHNLPSPMVAGHAAAIELYLSQGEKKLIDLYKED